MATHAKVRRPPTGVRRRNPAPPPAPTADREPDPRLPQPPLNSHARVERNGHATHARSDRCAGAAVGYLRRSTDRQEQSIPDQQRAVEAYCAAKGLTLLRCYTDDAISGTSTVGRKDFQKLIADAQSSSRDFSVIVCYDVKRFGRVGNDEAGYYRHVLRSHGVEVHYASENFAGDGTDDLLRPVKQWQAREESKDLSKVTIRGLVSKSSTGHWMGGAPPYGYDLRYESQSGEFLFVVRYLADGSKLMLSEEGKRIRTLRRGETVAVSRKDHCTLAPGEPSRVAIVRRIFRLYVDQGMGYKAIADLFNREKLPPARGPEWAGHYSGQWSMTTVRAILVNPAYRGDMVWNRRTDARFNRIKEGVASERKDVHARRLELNDRSDWTVVRDAHPALVTRRVWELAQAALEEKAASLDQRGKDQRLGTAAGERLYRKVGDLSGPRARFLLSKLVTCARCGSRYEGYTLRSSKAQPDGSREKCYTYACGGYIRRGKSVCELGAVPQLQLEEAVIAAVLKYYTRYEGERGRVLLGNEIRKALGLEHGEVEHSIERVRAELARLDATTRRLLDNVTPGTRAAVERRLREIERDRAALAGKAESLERMSLSPAEVREVVGETEGFIAGLPVALGSGPLQHRQAALRKCVDHLLFDHGAGTMGIRVRPVPAVKGADVLKVSLNGSAAPTQTS